MAVYAIRKISRPPLVTMWLMITIHISICCGSAQQINMVRTSLGTLPEEPVRHRSRPLGPDKLIRHTLELHYVSYKIVREILPIKVITKKITGEG